VLRSGAPITLIPLDVTRKIVFSPTDLLELPSPESRTCRFLRKIVPCGIRNTSNRYGVEGFHLKDVLGVAAITLPSVLTTKPFPVDVETRGELTRGMSVVDARPEHQGKPNVDMAVTVEVPPVREYIHRILEQTA
jgi:inosine-uridine nucleoside N-ribohydrolase